MNAFANWLFSVLLGWTGTFANGMWNAVVNQSTGISAFFSRWWLALVLLLVAGGTVLDYAVWLIRWRPYLVWRTWLTRRKRRRNLRRETLSLENTQMDDQTLSTIADWVASPQEESPVDGLAYGMDHPWAPAVGFNEAEASWQRPQAPVLQGRQEGDPAMMQNGQPPQGNEPPLQAAPYFSAVYGAPSAEAGGTSFAAIPLQHTLQADDFDNLEARWQPSVDFGDPYSMQGASPLASDFPARRRRSQRQKGKASALLDALHHRITGTDDDETMLDGLPAPVDQQDAFHEAVYPETYRYQTPSQPPKGRGGRA
ncbi:MAG: hypothetical protein AB9880_01150 [Christensenellales bacterium]